MGGADYRYFERYISVALVYWVISILIEYIGRSVENHMAIKAPEVTDISWNWGDHTISIVIWPSRNFQVAVLDGIDIDIEKGGSCAFVVSGAGKSTIRSLNYLERNP